MDRCQDMGSWVNQLLQHMEGDSSSCALSALCLQAYVVYVHVHDDDSAEGGEV